MTRLFFHRIFKALKYLAIAIFSLALILFGLGLSHRINEYRKCVVLPNGALIGYAALIDPSKYLWTPNVVLKFPDGTAMISHFTESFYFTKTTVYGFAGPRLESEKDYGFLYRPDVGLILGNEEPSKYERLKEEAGPIIWLHGYRIHTNLLGAYFKAIEKQKYMRSDCDLSLFSG